jgi:response regulator RpfG family c-di-GMP phosphodiesterase
MFQQYLTLCGAQVTGAGTAKAALAVLETHTVDDAVVDLRMPREDGGSFLTQLRASRTPSAHAAVLRSAGSVTINSTPRAALRVTVSSLLIWLRWSPRSRRCRADRNDDMRLGWLASRLDGDVVSRSR